MAKSKNIEVEITCDHEEFDRSLEKMEAAALRLLVLQLTARMDEAERHIIALQKADLVLHDLLGDGLDDIYVAVKSITLQSFGSEGTITHDPTVDPTTEVWTEVRKEDFANGWDSATRGDMPNHVPEFLQPDEVQEEEKRRGLRSWWPR